MMVNVNLRDGGEKRRNVNIVMILKFVIIVFIITLIQVNLVGILTRVTVENVR